MIFFMLHAYRLMYTNYTFAPPQLWETEQPHIDNLSPGARSFGHSMKHRFFLNKETLYRDNNRIWQTHYKPKPAHDHIAKWQAYLEWYRQVVVEVMQIAEETGWRGPEMPVTPLWKR